MDSNDRGRPPLTPEQRETVLREIAPLWNTPPDLRLGQLISNAISFWLMWNKRPAAARNIADSLYYIEDDDLLTTIARFVMESYPPKAGSSSTSS